MESVVRRDVVEQFRAHGVPDGMVVEKVKCKSGEVDIVIYTQPRCLIEVKPVLDNASLTDAIQQLKLYQADFPGARLFVASANPTVEPEWVRRRLRNTGIRLWSPHLAAQIAADCRMMPAQSNAVKRRKSLREPPTATVSDYAKLPGKSYRMARKYVSVQEAIRSLPPQDQRGASKALGKLAIGKAAILAPLIKRRPIEWRDAIEAAQSLNVDEVQKWVSTRLGAKPRGSQRQKRGERLYRMILEALPLKARDEAAAVFSAALKLNSTGDRIDALFRIISEAKNGLLKQLGTQHRNA